MALLTYYGDTGKFEEVKSNAGDIVMDSFKKKEYIRLKNAVEQLLNLQKELHKKSGSIYLSQDDEKEMVTKACMIGFQTDDGCIAEVIRGNEIKLGYSLKQEIAIRNKLIEENKNKLSRIASSKAVILLGEKYEFGSCYFVKNEIEQFYRKELTDLKQRTMLMMKRYDVSNVGGGIKFIDAIGPMLIQWGDIIEKYNSLANVSQKILEEIKEYYSDVFLSFGNDLEQIKDTFYDIEQEVEVTRVVCGYRDTYAGKEWKCRELQEKNGQIRTEIERIFKYIQSSNSELSWFQGKVSDDILSNYIADWITKKFTHRNLLSQQNFEGMHYDFTSLIAEHESAEDYCKDSDELNSKIKIYQEQYEKIESFFAPQEMIGTIQRIIKSNKGLDYSCTLRKLQECSDLIL